MPMPTSSAPAAHQKMPIVGPRALFMPGVVLFLPPRASSSRDSSFRVPVVFSQRYSTRLSLRRDEQDRERRPTHRRTTRLSLFGSLRYRTSDF